MDLFVSTTESPLQFLYSYLHNEGESYLHEKFVKPDEIGFSFIPKREVLSIQKILPRSDTRGVLLDEETNTREYDLTFPEFVQEEIIDQILISKKLIHQQSKINTFGQNEMLYKAILLDSLEAQKYIDKNKDLNFIPYLNKFISSILTYVYTKFNRFFLNIPEIKRVKKYYKTRTDLNLTGFKLNPQPRNALLKDIFNHLYTSGFITKSKNSDSLNQFFNGEIPKSKINWEKGLHELKYFIDLIIKDKILLKEPGQQWKYMQDIFTCQGEELEKDWNRNHNYLKSPVKRLAIEELVSMLQPRN